MVIEKTDLQDCYVIRPHVIGDNRGYFLESYNKSLFEEVTGNKVDFVQDNEAKSKKGVLRGLHFQLPPYTQAKLVRVTEGKVLDVVVDLRKESPTYGQYEAIKLSAKNKKQLFVPRGFAHGYVVLSKTAVFSYKVDNIYAPDYDSGIMWNDKDLNIDWILEKENFIISDKDMRHQSFKEFDSPF